MCKGNNDYSDGWFRLDMFLLVVVGVFAPSSLNKMRANVSNDFSNYEAITGLCLVALMLLCVTWGLYSGDTGYYIRIAFRIECLVITLDWLYLLLKQ